MLEGLDFFPKTKNPAFFALAHSPSQSRYSSAVELIQRIEYPFAKKTHSCDI
jgi:hypothetical protein